MLVILYKCHTVVAKNKEETYIFEWSQWDQTNSTENPVNWDVTRQNMIFFNAVCGLVLIERKKSRQIDFWFTNKMKNLLGRDRSASSH